MMEAISMQLRSYKKTVASIRSSVSTSVPLRQYMRDDALHVNVAGGPMPERSLDQTRYRNNCAFQGRKNPEVRLLNVFPASPTVDQLFTTAPSCFIKPLDSIKSWTGHFFWVDSYAFPISVPLYTGGILEKDSAPLLTAHQEETVRLLESHKAPFRRYPECFLCQVGLSKYYLFYDNSYPAYEYTNGSDMGLLDFIQTADPRKVRAVEVQKGADQVTLLESTKDCFMPLVIPAAGGSSSAAAAEVAVPTEERQEDVAPEDTYLNLADPDEDAIAVRQGEERVVSEQPKKVKRRRLMKQGDALPAKKLRMDHPSLASGTGGKTLANLEQIMPEGSHLLAREQPVAPSVVPPSQEGEGFVDLSAQGSFQILATAESSGTLSAPVDTAAAATTSTRPATASKAATDVGPSHPEESESSDDSFYEIPNVDPAMAKRWYVPKWNITNDSLLDDAFSCRTLSLMWGSGGKLEPGVEDLEILELKCKLAEKETEAAEVIRLRDQVSSLSEEKLISEVSSLHAGFQDFKKKMEVQQEEQAQELYNRVAELEAYVMDVSGRLEGEFYPTYLTTLAGRRAVDFGMQAGLEAGHEHGSAGDLS
ncbi:hypothetical protein Tco_0365074 [Tanacetum coccineum]